MNQQNNMIDVTIDHLAKYDCISITGTPSMRIGRGTKFDYIIDLAYHYSSTSTSKNCTGRQEFRLRFYNDHVIIGYLSLGEYGYPRWVKLKCLYYSDPEYCGKIIEILDKGKIIEISS